MEEDANKLHLKFSHFNSCTRVTVYAEYIYVLTEYYITLHAEIYSARSYEEKVDRACIT